MRTRLAQMLWIAALCTPVFAAPRPALAQDARRPNVLFPMMEVVPKRTVGLASPLPAGNHSSPT